MIKAKSCTNISQNYLYRSLGYIYKHIGTPKFLVKSFFFFFSQKSCISRHFTARPNKSSEATSSILLGQTRAQRQFS